MIAAAQSMTEELANLIVEKYLKGASVWSLHMSHSPVPRAAIVKLLHDRGVMRPTNQIADPSPAEIAERALAIRLEWSEEEAMRRWVGRSNRTFQSSLVGED